MIADEVCKELWKNREFPVEVLREQFVLRQRTISLSKNRCINHSNGRAEMEATFYCGSNNGAGSFIAVGHTSNLVAE